MVRKITEIRPSHGEPPPSSEWARRLAQLRLNGHQPYFAYAVDPVVYGGDGAPHGFIFCDDCLGAWTLKDAEQLYSEACGFH